VSEEELRVRKIKRGTVIDHISAGNALNVLKILGISGKEGYVVSISINVSSKKFGKKDIVKIEERELDPKEVDKIALLAPNATINIVRNYRVVDKQRVKLPDELEGFPRCINPSCVVNSGEPIEPKFLVDSKEPVKLRCKYCTRLMDQEDIIEQFASE